MQQPALDPLGLGALSPPVRRTIGEASGSELSLGGGKSSAGGGAASDGASAMSTDSSSHAARPPLGEVQNTFEFKLPGGGGGAPAAAAGAPAFKPFSGALLGAKAASAAPTDLAPGRRDQAPPVPAASSDTTRTRSCGGVGFGGFGGFGSVSAEPTTPGSVSSAARGGGNAAAAAAACAAPPPLATLRDITPSEHDTVTPLPASSAASAGFARVHAIAAAAGSPPGRTRGRIVWADILLWKEPLQSATLFLAGLGAFWLLTWAACGAHSMTLVSGLSYLLLADLGANFLRYFVSKPWHDKCLWGGAAQMKHFLTRVNAAFLHLAAAHDAYLSAVDPFVTLKVAGVLWATAWVGSFLSLWWCTLLAYLGAFTLPVAYQASRPQLAHLTKAVRASTIDKLDAAGLPRTVRFVCVASGVALLFVTTTWAQAAIGFFVATAYWRTLLAPREIDLIRTAAEPYTASVHKVGRRLSMAAGDAFERMSTAGPKSRTKSHFAAKERRE